MKKTKAYRDFLLISRSKVLNFQGHTASSTGIDQFVLQANESTEQVVSKSDPDLTAVNEIVPTRAPDIAEVGIVQRKHFRDFQRGDYCQMFGIGADERIEYSAQLLDLRHVGIKFPHSRVISSESEQGSGGGKRITGKLSNVFYSESSLRQLRIEPSLGFGLLTCQIESTLFALLTPGQGECTPYRANRANRLYPCCPVGCAHAFPTVLCKEGAYTLVNGKNPPERHDTDPAAFQIIHNEQVAKMKNLSMPC